MPDINKTSKEILQRAYDLKSKDETRQLYKDWAATYDETMVDGLSYSAPRGVVDILAGQLADKSALIADVGCGTGLTGKAAAAQGFENLVGLDFSKEMLEQAARLNIYNQLLNVDLTGRLAIESEKFDAAISSGLFTYGHLDANCLDEIFRIIAVGGLFACVVRLQVWQELGFAERFAKLEKQDLITCLDERDAGNYKTSQSADGRYLVFRKNRPGH